MGVIGGGNAPDVMQGVLQNMGRSMSQVEIGDAIHAAKAAEGMGAADDIVFDLSGGMWNSLNGEFIGKLREF